MKVFHRDNPLFSLCGLNCGLCQMYVGCYCPGCGGGDGNQSCAIARCSRTHGDVSYCFLCGEYPCNKYAGFDAYDSILPCRNRQSDIARAQKMGIDAYTEELRERMRVLRHLLDHYNDGRRKSFYLAAVYLLDFCDVQSVVSTLPTTDVPIQERAAAAVTQFQNMATARGVDLKLHKKPKTR